MAATDIATISQAVNKSYAVCLSFGSEFVHERTKSLRIVSHNLENVKYIGGPSAASNL